MDIGFAFLPEYRGRGSALEAAEAVMQYARERVGAKRIVARLDNAPSVRLLEKISLRPERTVQLLGDDSHLLLMVWDAVSQEGMQ